MERKVTKLMEKQEEHNAIVIDRLKKLEAVWKKANKSLGGLTEVLKMTHQLIGELREHAGNDIHALKREIARVEAEVEQKIERLRAAGAAEKVRG